MMALKRYGSLSVQQIYVVGNNREFRKCLDSETIIPSSLKESSTAFWQSATTRLVSELGDRPGNLSGATLSQQPYRITLLLLA